MTLMLLGNISLSFIHYQIMIFKNKLACTLQYLLCSGAQPWCATTPGLGPSFQTDYGLFLDGFFREDGVKAELEPEKSAIVVRT